MLAEFIPRLGLPSHHRSVDCILAVRASGKYRCHGYKQPPTHLSSSSSARAVASCLLCSSSSTPLRSATSASAEAAAARAAAAVMDASSAIPTAMVSLRPPPVRMRPAIYQSHLLRHIDEMPLQPLHMVHRYQGAARHIGSYVWVRYSRLSVGLCSSGRSASIDVLARCVLLARLRTAASLAAVCRITHTHTHGMHDDVSCAQSGKLTDYPPLTPQLQSMQPAPVLLC